MWHWSRLRAVYNQDNREKVARDEAKFEAEEKERREKHRKAESDYRHAALLARVRGEPLVRIYCFLILRCCRHFHTPPEL